MRRLAKITVALALVAVLLPLSLVSLLRAQRLEIRTEEGRKSVESWSRAGVAYYRLADIAEALGLRLREARTSIKVAGDRGEIELLDGRSIVRSGGQYFLLSGPVVRRESKDWFVPPDFLVNALPVVLSRRLDRMADGSYRAEKLQDNNVKVEVVTYADHCTVIIQPSRPSPLTVREFKEFIQIDFKEFVVRPSIGGPPPDPSIVSAVEFVKEDAFGGFRIGKGKSYSSFREFRFENPDRVVLEVYGGTPAARSSEPPGGAGIPAIVDLPKLPAGEVGASSPASGARALLGGVIIDPGHGGEDYGVDVATGTSEKLVTLNIAKNIETRLRDARVPVLLTRNRDVELPQQQRSAIANFHKAEVFVSIHTGGAPSSDSYGPIVYMHSGLPGGAGGAKREESADFASGLKLVPWEQGYEAFSVESRRLAAAIQPELNGLFGTDNSFLELPLEVLGPVTAPSVLIEAGFLTNGRESERLASTQFQEEVASAIVRGILSFLGRR